MMVINITNPLDRIFTMSARLTIVAIQARVPYEFATKLIVCGQMVPPT